MHSIKAESGMTYDFSVEYYFPLKEDNHVFLGTPVPLLSSLLPARARLKREGMPPIEFILSETRTGKARVPGEITLVSREKLDLSDWKGKKFTLNCQLL